MTIRKGASAQTEGLDTGAPADDTIELDIAEVEEGLSRAGLDAQDAEEDAADKARRATAVETDDDDDDDDDDLPELDEPQAKKADQTVLRYVGDAKTYTVTGRLVFEKGKAKRVPDAYVSRLLATGYFKRASEEALTEDAPVEIAKERKNFRVGDFKDKNEAISYALKIHGVTLSPMKSLRQLNEQVSLLAQAAQTTRDREGVVTLD